MKRLTPVQKIYLDVIRARGRLVKGHGGMNSTITVRTLEERGYVEVRWHPQGWVARPGRLAAREMGS